MHAIYGLEYSPVKRNIQLNSSFRLPPQLNPTGDNGAGSKLKQVDVVTRPQTQIKYLQMSTRNIFKRRSFMADRPLIIIYFDGTLGFLNAQNLYFRPGVAQFINRIHGYFQVSLRYNFCG